MVSILDGMGYTRQIPHPSSVSGNQTRDILSGVTFLAKCFCEKRISSQLCKTIVGKSKQAHPKDNCSSVPLQAIRYNWDVFCRIGES